MKQLIKLAWRNIWRKRKRSVIVLVSIAFAIIITISLRSLMLGNGDKMVEAGVKNVGYIQVHTADYWKDKSINDLLLDDDKLIDKINRDDYIVYKCITKEHNLCLFYKSMDSNTNLTRMENEFEIELGDCFLIKATPVKHEESEYDNGAKMTRFNRVVFVQNYGQPK